MDITLDRRLLASHHMSCLLLLFTLSLPYLCLSNPVQFSTKDAQCIYRNNTYNGGEKFYPEPCLFCKCPRHGGRVQCGIQDCQHTANCVQYVKHDGECCGRCVRQGCMHTDGQLYHAGAVVSATHCERCFCPDSGGRIECRKIPCPSLNCVNPVHDDGHCCARCPNGTNCWLGEKILSGGEIVLESRCRICSCYTEDLPSWMPGDVQPTAICYTLTDQDKDGCPKKEEMLSDQAAQDPDRDVYNFILHRDDAFKQKIYKEFLRRHHRKHTSSNWIAD